MKKHQKELRSFLDINLPGYKPAKDLTTSGYYVRYLTGSNCVFGDSNTTGNLTVN